MEDAGRRRRVRSSADATVGSVVAADLEQVDDQRVTRAVRDADANDGDMVMTDGLGHDATMADPLSRTRHRSVTGAPLHAP